MFFICVSWRRRWFSASSCGTSLIQSAHWLTQAQITQRTHTRVQVGKRLIYCHHMILYNQQRIEALVVKFYSDHLPSSILRHRPVTQLELHDYTNYQQTWLLSFGTSSTRHVWVHIYIYHLQKQYLVTCVSDYRKRGQYGWNALFWWCSWRKQPDGLHDSGLKLLHKGCLSTVILVVCHSGEWIDLLKIYIRLLRVVWVSSRTMFLSTPPLVSTSGVTVSNRG